MKKTVLRPKKEVKQNINNIKIQNKDAQKGYLDSDLEDPENKKIYENVTKRIQNNEIEPIKIIEQKQTFKNKNVNKFERSNRYEDMNNKDNTEKKLRRKTIDRGGKYKNIQSRYIIYSKKDIEFHIIEPMNVSVDKPLIYNKNRTKIKEPKGKVKVTYKSSCDKVKIRNKNNNLNKGKTVIYYHCAEINQKDMEKNKNKFKRNYDNINIVPISKTYVDKGNNKLENKFKNKNETKQNNKIKIENMNQNKENKIDDISMKIFLLKNYFRIFKNRIKDMKSDYQKWFKKHCEKGKDNNNNEKGKQEEKINNNLRNYLSSKIEDEEDINKKMPYEEWFDRNCEKSENLLKNNEEKEEKKKLINNLKKIILDEKSTNDKIKQINEEIDKYDINKKKEIIKSLKSNLKDNLSKKQLNEMGEIFNNIEEERSKNELIKCAQDDLTKNKLENLINLWEGEKKLLLTPDEKNKKFEEIYNLFKNEEKSKLMDELSKLNNKDKLEMIENLKNQYKSKEKEIDELNKLSEMKNKLEKLMKILNGNNESIIDKVNNKEKIKDILLNLDKNTRIKCINYMKIKTNEDEEKKKELISILNSLPEEVQKEENNNNKDNKDNKDIFNYSFANNNSLDKIKDNEINFEKKKEKELDDDLFDIVNAIDDEDEKKKLADDEFKEVSNNILFSLFENDEDLDDKELNQIVNILNDLDKSDKEKAIEKLREKADNEKKKKIFSKLLNRMKLLRNSINMLKNAINIKKKEKKPDEINLDDLKTESSAGLVEYRDDENNNLNNNDKIEDNMPEKIKRGKSFQSKSKKLGNNLNRIDFLNQTLNLRTSINFMNKTLNTNFNFDDDYNNNKNNLDKEELNKLINNIANDLFEEREKPLARKEERKNEKENKEKLKEIAKVIYSLSKSDKNKLFYKLGLKANNDFKTSQLEKLYNLVKNINNIQQYADDTINKKDEELSEDEYKEFMDKINSELFNDEDNDKEDKINEIAEKISNLSKYQQIKIMEELKLKNNDNLFNLLKNKLKDANKEKEFFKSLIIKPQKNYEEKKESNDNIKKLEVDLNEDDLIKVSEAILCQISLNDKINPQKIYIDEVENYLLQKEEENKLKEITKILNLLKNEDKQEILGILTYVLENKNEFIEKLNKEMKINNEIIDQLLEEYKKENDIKELDDNKLEELAAELMFDLMNESSDNQKRMKAINTVANFIINLNKNDQEKILFSLNQVKKNEFQKENMAKLNNLIENLNYMRLYLFSINQSNLNKDLDTSELNNIKEDLKSQLFNEIDLDDNDKNIDKIALRLSSLSNKDQDNILKEINEKANESNENSRKSIDKLNQLLKSWKIAQKFSTMVKTKKNKILNKTLSNEKLQELKYNLNDKLNKSKSPNNWTEKLLIDKNDERKIQNLAESINVLDEESKRKTISFLSQKMVNEKQKNDLDKLKNSIIINNDKSFNDKNTSFNQYYLTRSLGITDLDDFELNLLINAFSKDLFTEEIIDNNKREENLNLIANLIKELDNENQLKIIRALEKNPKSKSNENLKELSDLIIKLDLLKDEIKEEKLGEMFNQSDSEEEEEDLIQYSDDDEENEDTDQTITFEIALNEDDINENDLKEICKVFRVISNEEEKDKKQEKKNKNDKSISLLEGSFAKLNEKSQRNINSKLKERFKKKEEKIQLEVLLKNINLLNTCKKIGIELKNKKLRKEENLEKEIEDILKLNDNTNKNLEEENMNELMEKLINYLCENIDTDFNKNETIKSFIIEAKREENIWNAAEQIVVLSDKDKDSILDEIKNKTSIENEKMHIYNKLCRYIIILKKIKTMNNNIEQKKNDLIENDELNLSLEKSKDELESFIQKLCKENVEKSDIINVVNEILKLDDINQENFLNNLKQTLTSNHKGFIMKQFIKIYNEKKAQKNFADKVIERYLKKLILEKEKNEQKYGIFIDNKEKNETILLKHPSELKNDNFNQMKNNFLEDFKKMQEETEMDLSFFDEYTKKKEREKKLEDIANIINTLDNDDKTKILDEIKKYFDNTKDNILYNEFLEILEKRARKFDEEKRNKKKETYLDIEENRKNIEKSLLYSLVDVKDEKNYDSMDSMNMSHDAFENNDNKVEENNDNSIYTFPKGFLETQEIY